MTAPQILKTILAVTIVCGSLMTTTTSVDAGPRLIGGWLGVAGAGLGSGR